MEIITEINVEKMLNEEHLEQVKRAERIINRTSELVKRVMPAMVRIINTLEYRETLLDTELSTDGQNVYYNSTKIIKDYSDQGSKDIIRQYLHMLFHIVLGHVSDYIDYHDKDIFNAVAENEVNMLVNSLLGQKDCVLDSNCQNSYFAYKNGNRIASKIISKSLTNMRDDHKYWEDAKIENSLKGSCNDSVFIYLGAALSNDACARGVQIGKLLDMLKASHISFDSSYGSEPSAIVKEYGSSGKRYDWRNRLKDIIRKEIYEGELVDSIDKTLYTYSLDMYGNVAIVEPSEDEIIRENVYDLAIAIDTSGSCDGSTMQRFLDEVESILCDVKPHMGDKDTVHILECDMSLHNIEEFKKQDIYCGCFSKKKIAGFGGTDFNPVFNWVEGDKALESSKQDRTLLYLTDGYGGYPNEAPEYDVYFVIPEREKQNHEKYHDIPEYINVIYMEND